MSIGRDAETATIGQFVADIGHGPGVLFLEGEIGIGKTTLLREAHSAAAGTGICILSAEPVESEVPLSFAGLADLLATVPAAVIDELPVPQRQAIRQAVLRAEPPEQPGYRRTADPRTAATAVLTLLRILASRGPVLILVDDLPWLDPPSARALSFALRRLRLEPVGLLAAVRTGWSAAAPALATDSIQRERVRRLWLGPLSLGAIRELLATRMALSPGRSWLVRIHETSAGNPLFALELAASTSDRALPVPSGRPDAPESLRRLVRGRVTKLPAAARDMLLVSSLVTEPVLPVICAAARDPSTAHADLDAGIEAGLLAAADGAITFVHPLMRSVVADTAPAADRRAAHRRLAVVARGPEARARHLALGAEGPSEPAAAELEAAARLAACRGACDTAGSLAELAVTLTPLAEPQARQRRIILAAEQCFEASDPARASVLLQGVVDAVPAGAARAELSRRLARYCTFSGQSTARWATSLRQALAEAGADRCVRAAIMLDQAVCASTSGYARQALRIGEQVLELAGGTAEADRALAAQCCGSLAMSAFLLGQGLRRDLISRALSGAEQQPRLSMDLRPNIAVGHLLHWTDDLDGARALYEREHTRALEQGVETGLPFVAWALAETEAWAGNWPRAEQLIADGYQLAEDSGSPAAIGFMSVPRALLSAYRGGVEASASDAARATDLARELGIPLLAALAAQATGVAFLPSGDAAGAHARLGPLAQAAVAAGLPEPALCRFLPDEIEALIRLGQLATAESLLRPFEARSAELRRGWGMAAAGRCRGLMLAAAGDPAAGATALADAIEASGRLLMPFEQARTLLAAGEVYRRARHKQRALASLEAARAIFERLGAPLWQQRADDEISRVGMRARSRAAAQAAWPSASGLALTAAEQRVADLVTSGRTNPEIAAELFMGLRTVEAHLSRVYRKLSVRSRTELCLTLTASASSRVS
jgi:DNA-binding CsgD family transcriptional regulator